MKVKLDSGLLFGLGLFETIEVIRKKPIFLEKHLQRLHCSCSFFHLPLLQRENILQYIENVEDESFVLRLTVTEKNEIFTHRPHPYLTPSTPMKLKVSSLRRNPRNLMIYHKSIQYYENIYEKNRWMQRGFDEVLFLNTDNHIAEGAVSNIFWIKNNVLYTPAVGCGLLSGVMRNWVIDTAKEHYIPVYKGHFPLSALLDAQAVFITNSLMGIQSISQIENMYYNNVYHPIIRQFQQLYDEIRT